MGVIPCTIAYTFGKSIRDSTILAASTRSTFFLFGVTTSRIPGEGVFITCSRVTATEP